MITPGRHLRADAAHNRVQILNAAREAFSTEGLDVSMAEIARRAGVGFATAQRRFPTKDDLIREIIAEEVAQMHSSTVSPSGGETPWEAFTAPIRTCAAHQASQPGLAGAIAETVAEIAVSSADDQLGRMFAEVARHANETGVIRSDVTMQDVLAILKGNAGVIAHSPGNEVAASARFVDLALAGLRAYPRE